MVVLGAVKCMVRFGTEAQAGRWTLKETRDAGSVDAVFGAS